MTPPCFDTPAEFARWLESLRVSADKRSTICADCTGDYRREMRRQGRCQPTPQYHPLTCECGHLFTPTTGTQRYCSPGCLKRAARQRREQRRVGC